MKGQKRFWADHWKDVLGIIAFFGFLIGAIVLGARIWNLEFTGWKRWLAVILGEMVYFYSITFLIGGVGAFFNFGDKDWAYGIDVPIILILVSCILPTLFWGIVYGTRWAVAIALLLSIVVIVLAAHSYRQSK